ncbi:uncharacterized protein LOC135394600 [Ornithodoros turicata]|uniref:uncharacterized protein LOC135394600 n=1 Tax=Ornithodoros turicata TaxID=34597 RepID=UPI00313A29AB
MDEDLDTVKTVIRSLLVVSKKEVPLQAFLRDYRESEGQDLPFRQFGYKNVQEFLENLKDTVRVTAHGPNMVFLSPAITKDIQHIDKLVRTQKSTPSKRGSPRPPVRRPPRPISRPLVVKRPRNIVDTFHAKKSQGNIVNGGYTHQAFSSTSSINNSRDSDVENWDDETNCAAGDCRNPPYGVWSAAVDSPSAAQSVKEELGHPGGDGKVACETSVLNSWDAQAEAVLKDSAAVQRHPAKDCVQVPSAENGTHVFEEGKADSTRERNSGFSVTRSTSTTGEVAPPEDASHGSRVESPIVCGTGENWVEKVRASARPACLSFDFPRVPVPVTKSLQLPVQRVPQYSYSQGAATSLSQSVLYYSTSAVQPVPCGIYAPMLPVPGPPFVPPQVPYGGGMTHPMVGPPMMFNSASMTTSINAQLNAAAPPYVPRSFSGVSHLQQNIDNQSMNKYGTEPQSGAQSEETAHVSMPADVIAGVTSLLKSHPDGLNVKLLQKLYEEEIGQHNYFSSREWSPKDLIIEIIDRIAMVSVSSIAGGEFIVKLVEPVQTQDCSAEENSSGLPADVALGIEKILQKHPEGILVQELPKVYKAEYGPHPYFTKDGCNPTKLTLAVVSSDPSVTAITLNNRKCLLKLTTASSRNVQKREENRRSPSSAESVTTEEELSTYCRQTLPTTQEFSARLGEVYSPGAFYILINGENTTDALAKLMKDMNQFYDRAPPQRHKLNREDIRADVSCAATYVINGEPQWHRAQVLSRAVTKVNILYVDFGTCDQVSTDQLRRIDPRFMELPTQGIKVRLTGIKPRGSSTWSDDAKQHFLNLTRDADLQCKVEEWNGEDFGVKLWKVDDRERSIADVLVDDGYAEEVNPRQPAQISSWVIKPHYLREGAQLDIITWKGVRYVTGRNVSELFHWPPTAIEKMLLEKQIAFNVKVVSQSEDPALFVDITREQCSDISDESITLYKLQNLPDLLNLFSHPLRGIRREVEDILCDEVYLSDESTDEEEREEHQQKLEHKLSILQEERKELRMKVYAGDPSHKNDLSFLERKIECTRELLEQVRVQCQLRLRTASKEMGDRRPGVNGAVAAPVHGLQTKLMELLTQKKS